MGVSSQLFVCSNAENLIHIMPKVISALNKWQRNLRANAISNPSDIFDEEFIAKWSNGISAITTYDFGSFSLFFRVDGEQRRLFVTHTCSSDYSDIYEGNKIIFSLNSWGMDVAIMDVVANAVKEFGDVYYTDNDCDNEFIKINFNLK